MLFHFEFKTTNEKLIETKIREKRDRRERIFFELEQIFANDSFLYTKSNEKEIEDKFQNKNLLLK